MNTPPPPYATTAQTTYTLEQPGIPYTPKDLRSPMNVHPKEKLVDEYESGEKSGVASTQPLRSTHSIKWDVVDALPVGSANIRAAHLVARAGQSLAFFGYGMGDNIPDGLGGLRVSTELDTNISTGRKIEGDAVIEGLTCAAVGHRIKYPGAPAGVTDPTVLAAYAGTARSFDPAALMKPRQTDSPMNLEVGLFEAIRAACDVQVEFDMSRDILKLGLLDEIPDGGARSYLRSTGAGAERYQLREGLRLRSDGGKHSQFIVRVRLLADVVVPIDAVLGFFGTPGDALVPTAIATDIVMRLHGLRMLPGSAGCA